LALFHRTSGHTDSRMQTLHLTARVRWKLEATFTSGGIAKGSGVVNFGVLFWSALAQFCLMLLFCRHVILSESMKICQTWINFSPKLFCEKMVANFVQDLFSLKTKIQLKRCAQLYITWFTRIHGAILWISMLSLK
jgi:hypothetical protein